MLVLPASQIAQAEAQALASGLQAEALMEEAGKTMARALAERFPHPGLALVYLGTGHNAGDALVIARELRTLGWKIHLRPVAPLENVAPLTARKWRELGPPDDLIQPPTLLLDGLLGLGATGPLRPRWRELTRELNTRARQAPVAAIDLPSGLDSESAALDPDTVRADLTLVIAAIKASLLADHVIDHVGSLVPIPLSPLDPYLTHNAEENHPTRAEEPIALGLTPAILRPHLPRPPYSTHKGQMGRLLIYAGSPRYLGATVLCAQAALHAGAGLTTLFAPGLDPVALRAQLPPEVMLITEEKEDPLPLVRPDALVIGPGLGSLDGPRLRWFDHLLATPLPTLLDADALNHLAAQAPPTQHLTPHPNKPRLITPHPGEMARLWPPSQHLSRADTVRHYLAEHPVTLLLKGARTLIAEPGSPLYYNTTGHPGLATGGSGDTLSGLAGALLARGLSPLHAACAASWILGRSAERAHAAGESAESIRPSQLSAHFGACLREIHG